MSKTNKQTQLVEGFEEVTNEYIIWKPSLNDEFTGKIVKRQKSKFGESFVLEKDDEQYLMPNHAVLEGLLEKCNIGDTVRIECTGFKDNKDGKNKTTLYKLYIKRS